MHGGHRDAQGAPVSPSGIALWGASLGCSFRGTVRSCVLIRYATAINRMLKPAAFARGSTCVITPGSWQAAALADRPVPAPDSISLNMLNRPSRPFAIS